MKIAIFGKTLSWQAPNGVEPVELMPPSAMSLQAAIGGVTTAMLLVVAGTLWGAAWWWGPPAVMPLRSHELAGAAGIPWGTLRSLAMVLGVSLFALTAAVARQCLPAARWLIWLTLIMVLAISLASPAHPITRWMMGLAVVFAEITVTGLQRALSAPRSIHSAPASQPVAVASHRPLNIAQGTIPAIDDTQVPIEAGTELVHAGLDEAHLEDAELEDAELEDAELEDANSPMEEACDQAIWRSFEGPTGDMLRALLRCRIDPRQRTGTVHVGFCPPFRTIPEISIRTVDGSLARLTVAEKLAWGARVDVRLPQECSEASCCVLELIAQVPTD